MSKTKTRAPELAAHAPFHAGSRLLKFPAEYLSTGRDIYRRLPPEGSTRSFSQDPTPQHAGDGTRERDPRTFLVMTWIKAIIRRRKCSSGRVVGNTMQTRAVTSNPASFLYRAFSSTPRLASTAENCLFRQVDLGVSIKSMEMQVGGRSCTA